MDAIKGELVFEGRVTVAMSADPGLELGQVIWAETKEPTLLRPIMRRRLRVIEKTEDFTHACITYKFTSVPPDPAWSQRPSDP